MLIRIRILTLALVTGPESVTVDVETDLTPTSRLG